MSFDPARVRAEFPLLADPPGGRLHYLDSAATAQVPQAVLDAMAAHDTRARANVDRGVYRLAEAASAAYAGARARVARYLGADPGEVVFTSGTTAAINLVAQSFGRSLKPGDEILLTQAEHHSNLVPWQMLREARGLRLKFIPVADDGRLDLGALDSLVGPRCRLIALGQCSNVTGAVADVARVAAAARAVGAKVLLDGAQGAPRGPQDMKALGCDFYAFSGHKCFGPTGVGVLWAKREILESMPPVWGGGGMIRSVALEGFTPAPAPERFEAGTPPIAQAVGLAAALDWIAALDLPAAHAHEAALTARALSRLPAVPGLRIVGPTEGDNRIGVVSFDLRGVHTHDVAQALDSRGVAVRGGHHCAQPLMDRFGFMGVTRASFAPYNTTDDVDALLAAVAEAARIFG